MRIFKKQTNTSKNKTWLAGSFLFALLLAVAIPMNSHAQAATGLGIRAGLNYNGNGKYFSSAKDVYQNPDKNIGYHIGVFGKVGSQIYLKPEFVYTNTKSDYNDGDFKMQKLDLPVLVGAKVIGPVSVFGGPAFQYILNTKFNDVTINDVKNDFTVGLNFGIGLNINKLGIDLRYERGFNKNEAQFVESNGLTNPSRIDTRPDQIILSLSLIL